MKLWLVVGVGLLLGSCAGSPMRTAMMSPEERAKEDDTKCRDFGATPGTQAYFDCRMRLDERRAHMMAEARRQAASTPIVMSPPPQVPDLSGYATLQSPTPPPQQPINTFQARSPIICTTPPAVGQTVTTTCR